MESIKPNPIKLDFKDIRKIRQDNNNEKVYKALKENNKKVLLDKINLKEYYRTLTNLEIEEQQFMLKCREDDMFCKLGASHISKKTSRQGSKDEIEQLKICNLTGKKCGVFIDNLSANELRPTKDGLIISKKEMTEKKIQKDCCLKSFDGKITGKINGFITAKVAFGGGGHQDNVFEEMDTMAEWWQKYKIKSTDILVILIDTDLKIKFERLSNKYNTVDNLFVFNHYDFQKYMIDTHYIDESI